jgi:hypothetical protein
MIRSLMSFFTTNNICGSVATMFNGDNLFPDMNAIKNEQADTVLKL